MTNRDFDRQDGIAYHEVISDTWEDRYNSGSFRRRFEFIRDRVLSQLVPGGHWLDAGCGTGTFSRMLLEHGAEQVTGIDGAERMIARARAAAQATNATAEVLRFERVNTVEDLPFNNASFDHAISFSVLEYVAVPERVAAEIARVLRPGGTCIVSIPNPRSAIRRTQYAARSLLEKRRGGTGGVTYLESSRFCLDPREAVSFFHPHGLKLLSVDCFDPYIPRILFTLLQPAMSFFVLKKSCRVG